MSKVKVHCGLSKGIFSGIFALSLEKDLGKDNVVNKQMSNSNGTPFFSHFFKF